MKYSGEYLSKISFPLGGIGTGCIGLAGNGMLTDWEIFNRPNKGGENTPSFFAVVAEYPDGRRTVKALHGDMTDELIGRYTSNKYSGFGHGPNNDTMCGYPHFSSVVFDGTFPIATLTFSDKNFPGNVILTAWNPFIPLDSENSSIPAAFFDIRIENSVENVKYYAILSMKNPFPPTVNLNVSNGVYTAIKLCPSDVSPDDKEYGDMTVAVGAENGIVQKYWYRGGSRDAVTMFMHELETGVFTDRNYDVPGKRDVCSVGAEIPRGKELRFVISWNVPNCYNYWDPFKDENGNDVTWKNYYATRFEDSTHSCFYALSNYTDLFEKTAGFRNAMFAQTLDPAVIDAAASNLSVLRSPTVMRLENGAFYGFEGTNINNGSCEGTCTHVWSYAYALCFLFPDLERSIRETEFRYDTAENGRMRFRTLLPLGRTMPNRPQCLDGQALSVVKAYREWKISGDDEWIKTYWPTVKKVLEYIWSEENYNFWDLDHDGVLEGRQHNTLDADLFGPCSWHEGLYMLALRAGAEIADFTGDHDSAKEYRTLFNGGYNYTKEKLFNGKYFIQDIDVSDASLVEKYDAQSYYNEETGELKYQIGEGSEIDQMLGQWHANILSLGDIFDRSQRKTALQTMMKLNFKPSLRDFPNMWRVYALGDEAGAIICAYPDGAKRPAIPIQYCDECMTGFEYALAGLMISEGMIDDGLTIVRAVRDRYDGKKRNPYSEIECGSNYARSMASFALIPIFGGFSFDMSEKTIGFAPLTGGDFRCVWSLGSGWGEFLRSDEKDEIILHGGYIELSSVALKNAGNISRIFSDGKPVNFTEKDGTFRFDMQKIEKSLAFVRD